jgi:hypothetical protein
VVAVHTVYIVSGTSENTHTRPTNSNEFRIELHRTEFMDSVRRIEFGDRTKSNSQIFFSGNQIQNRAFEFRNNQDRHSANGTKHC